jgi:hypothetical protein
VKKLLPALLAALALYGVALLVVPVVCAGEPCGGAGSIDCCTLGGIFEDDAKLGGNNICQSAPTSDVAPDDLIVSSAPAYPQGTQTASDLILAGGLDEKYITVDDYTLATTDTVTTTVNDTALAALVEGTDFDCITSNAVCATNLAAAMTAQSGITAAAVGAVVYLTPIQCPTWGLSTAVADGGVDGAFATATNGTDGVVRLGSDLDLNGAHALIVDADGDSLIEAAGDDIVDFDAGGVTRLRLQNTQVKTWVPFEMNGQRVWDDGAAVDIGSTGGCSPSVVADAAGNVCMGGDSEVVGSLAQSGSNGQTIERDPDQCQTLTFAANPGDATKTTSSLVPDGAWLYSISTRVLVQGTNCTDFDIGDGTSVNIFGDAIAVTAGTTTTNADAEATYANPIGVSPAGDMDVTLTANGGNCFDLSVRVCPVYETFGAPAN